MPESILQNEATAVMRETTVQLVDSSGNPVTGQNEGTVAIKIAKAGASALVASTATLTEVTDAAVPGLYRLRFPVGEVDTVGDLEVQIVLSGTIAPIRGTIPITPGIRVSDLASSGLATLTALTVVQTQTDLIPVILALLHHNAKIDKTVYVNGFLTSARIRGFSSAGALAAATGIDPADGAESETYRFTITGVDEGNGTVKSYKIARNL